MLSAERLKASRPGDFIWEASTYGKNESKHGANVQDGFSYSFASKGGPNRTIDSNWGGRRRFETSHGWYYQDLRAPDKFVEPEMGATPQYSWRNKIATAIDARHTGRMFAVPRGGIMGGPTDGLTRGGAYPRVTDIVGGDDVPGYTTTVQGPGSALPNFHPHLSTFGGDAQESQRVAQARGPPGRMRR